MSQGEYIAAEKVESVYGKSSCVGQIWVYGNSFQSFLLAVVVPNMDSTIAFLKEQSLWTVKSGEELHTAFQRICTKEKKSVKAWVASKLKEQETSLKGFEKVVMPVTPLSPKKSMQPLDLEEEGISTSCTKPII
mmetsp:Transcript_27952/g.45499  ORF Transcript_27952/g.45499 Transcript_27952/m.45499 type:complete len:134 (+) Transcript_27952:224-625(+)